MTKEEKKALEYLRENSLVRIENEKIVAYGNSYKLILLNLIEKQEKLINIFIHNEAVKEGKDFNEIKEKYYECL